MAASQRLLLAAVAAIAGAASAAPAPRATTASTQVAAKPRIIMPAEPGLLAAEVVEVRGGGIEVALNGNVVGTGDRVVLGPNNALAVQAVVVGPRRRQSRELRTTRRRDVTLEAGASDTAFAYRVGKAVSRWNVIDEGYDWTFAPTSAQVIEQTLDASRAGVVEDRLTFVFSSLTTGETLDLAIEGSARWGMAGTRADGTAASGHGEDVARAEIVVRVAPRG